jgi:drug/metabolite transporter (DMT)-like permease
MAKQNLGSWIIFIALSFIWGSSFILMKLGLRGLSAVQVASLRIIFSALFLIPLSVISFSTLPKNKWFPVFFSGLLGSLLPAYLFCIAEQGIDSALAGTLNSLTPIFVIITGALFFGIKASSNKISGILIALTGSFLLFLSQPANSEHQNLLYVGYVLIATFCYGLNVNLVHKYLHGVPSLQIAALALTLNAIPATIVLAASGYFSSDFSEVEFIKANAYAALLGIAGTAIASVIFYKLIKTAGVVFASLVTYGIPFVACMWGLFLGEEIGWKQWGSLVVMLSGVYLANRNR